MCGSVNDAIRVSCGNASFAAIRCLIFEKASTAGVSQTRCDDKDTDRLRVYMR